MGGNSGTNIVQTSTKMHAFLCKIYKFSRWLYPRPVVGEATFSRIPPTVGKHPLAMTDHLLASGVPHY